MAPWVLRNLPFEFGITFFFAGSLLIVIGLLGLFVRVLSGVLGILVLAAAFAFWILGFSAILPEMDRLRDSDDESVRSVKLMMTLGIFVPFAYFFGVGTINNIASDFFGIELPFRQGLSLVRVWILWVGFPFMGIAALLSRRRWPYKVRETTPLRSRLSLQKILEIAGGIMLFAGVTVGLRFAAPSLFLLVGGAIAYPAGRMLRRKTPVLRPVEGSWKIPMSLEFGKASYEQRLMLGKQISDLIVRNYDRAVRGVCIWNETTKGDNLPNPDLEILAVLRDDKRVPTKQYLYGELFVRIAYWPESTLLKNAEAFDIDWPEHSVYVRNRTVLFERDRWFRRLEKALEESDKADPSEAIRESTWKVARALAYLRSDKAREEKEDMKSDCRSIAIEAANLVYILNRRYWRDDYWKDVFTCPMQPPDFQHQV